MAAIAAERAKTHGDFIHEAADTIQLAKLGLWNDAGGQTKWSDYKAVAKVTQCTRLRDIAQVLRTPTGATIVVPKVPVLMGTGKEAALFREVVLNVLASYPEIVTGRDETARVRVHHSLEDPHHTFELESEQERRLRHSWASMSSCVDLEDGRVAVERAAADTLAIKRNEVWVVPHPWITKSRPLWAGKRRWTQKRKHYKQLINEVRDMKAETAKQAIQDKWRRGHPNLAAAIQRLEWKRIGRMEGVTPYQAQNIRRLKAHRLRLWTGKENGYKCMGAQCTGSTAEGSGHLAWECGDAQHHWRAWLDKWGRSGLPAASEQDISEEERGDIFAFQIRNVPQWLRDWGQQTKVDTWELLHQVAGELWTIGCAVILTAIWRWNVDRLYSAAKQTKKIEEQVSRALSMVTDAFERYRLGLYPITQRSQPKIEVAAAIIQRWKRVFDKRTPWRQDQVVRIGFFDGGSRGNPGAGGSGSVIVQLGENNASHKIIWAAATALGRPDTTNNIAEFIGLHRLLAHAVEKGWMDLHVVGDSALILGMTSQAPPLRGGGFLISWSRSAHYARLTTSTRLPTLRYGSGAPRSARLRPRCTTHPMVLRGRLRCARQLPIIIVQ